jgi:hypothetical protein
VNVLDKVKPTIQLIGDISYTICRFDTFEDPGYIVKDNYDPNPKVVKSGTYITNYLPYRALGSYELIYTATDVSANRTVISRFITVSDQESCKNSIDPTTQSEDIKLYPNPGNGAFSMEFGNHIGAMTEITIYNTLGKVIYNLKEEVMPNQVKTFNYQDMKPGMYLIKVAQNDKITLLKYNIVK